MIWIKQNQLKRIVYQQKCQEKEKSFTYNYFKKKQMI